MSLLLASGAAAPPATIGARFALAAVKRREHPEEEDAIRTDHSRRLLFGRSAAAAPTVGAPWHLWRAQRAQIEAEDDAPRATHVSLHRFRTVYQTVGQGYRLWPPAAKADQSVEPDAQRADHTRLHRYRVGYQTVGQNYRLWPRAQARIDEADFELPRRASLDAYRQSPAVSVRQPWWMWPRSVADQTMEPESPRIATSLYPFRRNVSALLDDDMVGGGPRARKARVRNMEAIITTIVVAIDAFDG